MENIKQVFALDTFLDKNKTVQKLYSEETVLY